MPRAKGAKKVVALESAAAPESAGAAAQVKADATLAPKRLRRKSPLAVAPERKRAKMAAPVEPVQEALPAWPAPSAPTTPSTRPTAVRTPGATPAAQRLVAVKQEFVHPTLGIPPPIVSGPALGMSRGALRKKWLRANGTLVDTRIQNAG